MPRMSEHDTFEITPEAVEARRRQTGGHLDSHGHSRAAWAGVGTVMLGSLIAAIATVFAVVPVFWVGIVIMALGGPLGWFLGKRGYGAQGLQGGAGEKKAVR
jgi:hypothetical protein